MSQGQVRLSIVLVVLCLGVTTIGIGVAAAQQGTPVITSGQYRAEIKIAAHKKLIAEVEADRAGFIERLVTQWAPAAATLGYVEGWAEDFRGALAAAAADRLAEASEAQTYDDVRVLLAGKGVQARIGLVSFSQALTSQALSSNLVTPQALGDTSTDLVFYPVEPCRIMDTRISTLGYIAANGTRSFSVNTNLVNQGGNAAGCGLPIDPIAVVINVTATNQASIGDLRIYPYGSPAPMASILNFKAFTDVANAAIVQQCYLCGPDLTILSDVSGSHVVVDVLGYFRSPTYTTLQQTVEVSPYTTVASGGAWAEVTGPTCPTGYVMTGGGYNYAGAATGVWVWESSPLNDGSAWFVRIKNDNPTTGIQVYAKTICNRVPGR
jgi:hypothetical protein